MTEVTSPVLSSWDVLPAGARAALEQQWDGLASGGLPCGAALVDATGTVLTSGRNRAYDEVTGVDPLEGTPLAHAELNVLARVSVASDLAGLTVWSSQRPCAMCGTAIAYVGIGTVRYLAEDPSVAAAFDGAGTTLEVRHSQLPLWSAVSTILFVATGAAAHGSADLNLSRLRRHEPETAALVLELVVGDRLRQAARSGRPLPAVVAEFADRLH